MDQDAFVAVLGTVFEHTPAIAAEAWQQRPFTDIEHLHRTMMAVVAGLSPEAKLTLLRAHPDLGTRAKMAADSVQEQSGIGLDRLSPEEFAQFQALNRAYRDKFGFPFLIAVRNHTRASILAAFAQRLENSPEAELAQALAEIGQITRLRLLERLDPG